VYKSKVSKYANDMSSFSSSFFFIYRNIIDSVFIYNYINVFIVSINAMKYGLQLGMNFHIGISLELLYMNFIEKVKYT